jgi:hypothetical protein
MHHGDARATLRRVRRLPLAALLASCAGAPAKPTPPATAPAPSTSAVAEPAPYVGVLVRAPHDRDVVSPIDRPVRPDGNPDFAFRVRLSGRVRALYLLWTDGEGRAVDHDEWDTVTRTTTIPKAIGSPFVVGSQTFALAVVDARGVVLNPDGDLPETTFHDEIVTIYACDSPVPQFLPGRAFTLWVERPGGAFDRTTTVLV